MSVHTEEILVPYHCAALPAAGPRAARPGRQTLRNDHVLELGHAECGCSLSDPFDLIPADRDEASTAARSLGDVKPTFRSTSMFYSKTLASHGPVGELGLQGVSGEGLP